MSLKTIHNIRRLSQIADKAFDQSLSGTGITPRQAVVIEAIQNKPGLSQHAYMLDTNVDRSTISDVIRRLQKKGLTKRTRSRQDARAYNVNLTAAGERVAKVIAKASTEIARKINEQAKTFGITVTV